MEDFVHLPNCLWWVTCEACILPEIAQNWKCECMLDSCSKTVVDYSIVTGAIMVM